MESLEILLQAPKEIRSLDFRIPFQIHESEDLEGEERKDSEERYLSRNWEPKNSLNY